MGRAPKCTYGEACVKWGKQGAPQSMTQHIRVTLVYLKDTQLTDCVEGANQMKEIMLAQGLKNTTINRRLACVRRVLNLAYREWDLLDIPLAEKISLLSEANTARINFLEPHELDALIDACKHPQAKNFFKLAAYTGARKSELLRAQQKDFRNGHLTITKAKSGKRRIVPVPKELWPVCNALPFTITEHELRYEFERARVAIGRPEIWQHDLRHSYATWMLEKGVPATVVRDILGHSSLAVTSKYAHSVGIDIDEIFTRS